MRTIEDLVSFPRQAAEFPFSVEAAGVSYCQGDYIITRKRASIAVFEYIRKGKGTLVNNGQRFSPAQGDVYLLLPGSDHTYYADSSDPWEKIWFNVYGGLIDKAVDLYGLRDVTLVEQLACEEIFLRFNEIAQSSLPYDEICRRCAPVFLELVIRIAERVSHPTHISKDAAAIKDFLDRNIERSVTLGELAESIYRSRSQTIRIFKEAFGSTPYDYFLGLKLERAKILLSQTNLSIKEVAYRLKFSDEHYFSRLFKQKTGHSPEIFRKSLDQDTGQSPNGMI